MDSFKSSLTPHKYVDFYAVESVQFQEQRLEKASILNSRI